MLGSISWLFFLCLMVLSAHCQNLSSEADLEFNCSLNQNILHLKFFKTEQMYEAAKMRCESMVWDILDNYTLTTSKSCIGNGLKSINPAGIWLKQSNTHVTYFNMTDEYPLSKDLKHKHSTLCIKQDVVITKFTVDPATDSRETNVDLLSLGCGQEHKFNLTNGQHLSLKCEATGIPAPTLILTRDFNSTNNFSTSNAFKVEIKIPLETFGSEENITCNVVKSNKSASIVIKKFCSRNNSQFPDCLSDKLQYIIITVNKLAPCHQPTAPVTNSSTDVPWTNKSCQEIGASNCTDRTNSGTAHKNSTDRENMSEADTTSKPAVRKPESSHLDVAIPVALATAAVVTAVCCIIFVVCSIVVYRKRENIIDKLCTYASLKESNKQSTATATENIFEESSLFIPIGRTQTQDEQELYSTVVTVNPYHNIKSILEASCSDEQKEILQETKFSNKDPKMYGELADMGLSAGYTSSGEYGLLPGYSRPSAPYGSSIECDPSTVYYNSAGKGPPANRYCSSETKYGDATGKVSSHGLNPPNDNSDNTDSMESSRYVSDGLIYITTESTGTRSHLKPIKKAISADHVEYTTLDYAKMHKLHLKRQKKRLTGKKKTKSVTRH